MKGEKERVLVVALHPDDETLGCGGTLLRHKDEGDSIYWLIATQVNSKSEFYNTRENEIEKVSQMYGFDGVYKLGFQTMHIDEYSMSELIGKISKVVSEVKPSVMYLPFKGDVHSDHRKFFEAAYSCTKSFRYPFIKKVYMMETLSETEFAPSTKEDSFVPNVFVDITKYIDKKCQIMSVYKSEIADLPFPRSIENIRALAIYRGCTLGKMILIPNKASLGGGVIDENTLPSTAIYAECFMLLKERI